MACGGARHIESSIGVMSSESAYLSFTSRTLTQGKSGCYPLFGMIRGPDKDDSGSNLWPRVSTGLAVFPGTAMSSMVNISFRKSRAILPVVLVLPYLKAKSPQN